MGEGGTLCRQGLCFASGYDDVCINHTCCKSDVSVPYTRNLIPAVGDPLH
jgi:hypothetical protein